MPNPYLKIMAKVRIVIKLIRKQYINDLADAAFIIRLIKIKEINSKLVNVYNPYGVGKLYS